MFKNMKIGMKLLGGFGLMAALLAILAAIGITRLGLVNEATQAITQDKYPKTVLINDLVKRTLDNTRQMRNILLVKDESQVEQFRRKVAENRSQNTASLDKLDKAINTDKGRELFRVVSEKRAVVSPKYDEFLRLEKVDRQQAADYLVRDLTPSNNAYMDSLEAMAGFQAEMVNKSAEQSASAYAEARSLMLALSGIGLLLAMAAGAWITRSITRPLQEAVDAADRQASGRVRTKLSGLVDAGSRLSSELSGSMAPETSFVKF